MSTLTQPDLTSFATQLILVDGITGSGKTTTSQRLYLHLLELGYDAEWFYEVDTQHPILPYQEIEAALAGGETGARDLQNLALQRWQALSEQASGSKKIYVIEAMLFQHNFFLALSSGLSDSAIKTYINEIGRCVAALKPKLIYFHRQEIEQSLYATIAQRGESYVELACHRINSTVYGQQQPITAIEQLVALLQHQQAACEAILPDLPMPVLAIENSAARWPVYEQQITDFLGLPPIGEFCTRLDALDPFVGTYKDHQSEDRFSVISGGEHLYLDFGTYQPRLYHKAGRSFWLEGMNVEMTFKADLAGNIDRFECLANLPGLSALWLKEAVSL